MDTDNNIYRAPALVVMLTNNDYTVANAAEIFDECRHSQAHYWGMKEEGLPVEKMKALYSDMKNAGKTTVLEVVAYSEAEGMNGAGLAAKCGCDIVMGTMFSKAIADFCHSNGMRYMPFVGEITGRPSVLEGTIDGIVEEARRALESGADGIDLLGYRFTGDAIALNNAVCQSLPGKVCLAGSVDSYRRLDEVIASKAAMFTIGSAFFANKFDGTFCEQIDKVCQYINNSSLGV